jgi:hypothetical protein
VLIWVTGRNGNSCCSAAASLLLVASYCLSGERAKRKREKGCGCGRKNKKRGELVMGVGLVRRKRRGEGYISKEIS